MNAIETLRNRIVARVPNATAEIEEPNSPNGIWFLDLDLNGHFVVVEWSPSGWFSVTSIAEPLYMDGRDEIYENPDEVFARATALLLTRGRTSPKSEAAPKELSTSAAFAAIKAKAV